MRWLVVLVLVRRDLSISQEIRRHEPDRRVQQAGGNAGDVAEAVRAALVAERVAFGGHVLRSLDGARRPSARRPDLGEADLQARGAETDTRSGSLCQRSSRAAGIVA